MRIVLDTNVVVSALLWRGTPHQLWQIIREHPEAQLFTSTVLLEEFAEVLNRSMAAKRLALINRTYRDILSDYVSAADIVTPRAIDPIVATDPADDHVLAAAIAADADILVCGDIELLTTVTRERFRVTTPAAALQIIRSGRWSALSAPKRGGGRRRGPDRWAVPWESRQQVRGLPPMR